MFIVSIRVPQSEILVNLAAASFSVQNQPPLVTTLLLLKNVSYRLLTLYFSILYLGFVERNI
jgi:hypothetical protein